MNKCAPLFIACALFLAACNQNNEPVQESSSKPQETSIEASSSIPEESSSKPQESSLEASSSESEELSTETEDSSLEPVSSGDTSEDALDPKALYGGYYQDLVSWTDGENLIEQLHDIISGGTYAPIEYNHNSVSNWQSNLDADEAFDDYEMLDVVYSGAKMDKTLTSSGWQREHAFCASLMTGSTTGNAVKHLGRATDFHNLFAGDASANSSRGNKNFGVADQTADTYQNRLDSNGDGYSFDAQIFEPSDYDKGRLSRAIFYMATMYNEEDYDDVNDVLMGPLQIVEDDVPYVSGDNCAFAIGHLSTLLEWTDIPVDEQEYQHNESVYSFVPDIHMDKTKNHAQGNRNPYVDFPELVRYAYGDLKDQPGTLEELHSSYETLHKNADKIDHYAIVNAKRSYVVGDTFNKDDLRIVSVDNKGNKAEFVDFSSSGIDFGDVFDTAENRNITIKTPVNDITYSVKVVTEDPLQEAQYQHKLTAKSAGQDFENCYDKAKTENRLDLSGVEWDVYWETGVVASNSSKFGCKFGANASSPVKYLRFKTVGNFEYEDLSLVKGVYLSGATASKCSYDLKISLGDDVIYKGDFSYIDDSTKCERYAKANPSREGPITIEFSNITNALYVHTIAVVCETID